MPTWKVTCIKDYGSGDFKLPAGTEVLIEGNQNKPQASKVKEAFEAKLGKKIANNSMGDSRFIQYEKL